MGIITPYRGKPFMENNMTAKEDTVQQEPAHKVACADFSFQFSAAREYQKVEKKIFNTLCSISKKNLKKPKFGILIVLGVFDTAKDYLIHGMRQIGRNPIQKYIDVSSSSFDKDVLALLKKGTDGAIIVNRNGQIIGSEVYLIVENPSLEVPEGCGTRHISAASFSVREDVLAVFTLSEETSVVRNWKNGEFVDQYDPLDDEELESGE
tara:strand:- start:4626 stop:5249 length:624 start_codon:yes stop_codon:yes gene_type:complete